MALSYNTSMRKEQLSDLMGMLIAAERDQDAYNYIQYYSGQLGHSVEDQDIAEHQDIEDNQEY